MQSSIANDVCRFHRIKRKKKEKEMRKELEKEGVAVEETEPLLRQRAMVGGAYWSFVGAHLTHCRGT